MVSGAAAVTTLLDPLDLEPGEAVVDEVPLWIGGTADDVGGRTGRGRRLTLDG